MIIPCLINFRQGFLFLVNRFNSLVSFYLRGVKAVSLCRLIKYSIIIDSRNYKPSVVNKTEIMRLFDEMKRGEM